LTDSPLFQLDGRGGFRFCDPVYVMLGRVNYTYATGVQNMINQL
jgi:hypothetical protein